MITFDDSGIKVELSKDGRPVVLRSTSQPPYGFSFWSTNCCLEFSASPGDELTLSTTVVGGPSQPIGRELFVISDWTNSKDLIVGVLISDDLVPYCRWAMALGGLLILVSAALIVSFVSVKPGRSLELPFLFPFHSFQFFRFSRPLLSLRLAAIPLAGARRK